MRARLMNINKKRKALVLSYSEVATVAKMTGQLVHDIECGVIPPIDEDVSRIEEALNTMYEGHLNKLEKAFGKQGKLF